MPIGECQEGGDCSFGNWHCQDASTYQKPSFSTCTLREETISSTPTYFGGCRHVQTGEITCSLFPHDCIGETEEWISQTISCPCHLVKVGLCDSHKADGEGVYCAISENDCVRGDDFVSPREIRQRGKNGDGGGIGASCHLCADPSSLPSEPYKDPREVKKQRPKVLHNDSTDLTSPQQHDEEEKKSRGAFYSVLAILAILLIAMAFTKQFKRGRARFQWSQAQHHSALAHDEEEIVYRDNPEEEEDVSPSLQIVWLGNQSKSGGQSTKEDDDDDDEEEQERKSFAKTLKSQNFSSSERTFTFSPEPKQSSYFW
eukprot:CAMPEP_0116841530 /NCGR_PEP_ID=MMETSP0418-20121206/10987_1 /TAXON_ID=1158023 /ORGANISM="Astrosyne radiata, Strain 13vi08-1A" /LENGTH=313 /DNA_ID=CAMNT_0004471989 /DNA_START=335 /DNA_END=1276 /DNA_ORIENTATION=-